ncbi:hypothetical protein EDD68_10128 [Melghiribacillus thermohalophilus]|uniref:Uncharacterized protein n=1 Tax=Melghiribacillus thermohalophilus TaxID=1324956 RepID=A0A4R3NDI4_9BACI|nr:hypothetical protein EDD68_10128 [Melghiribacillus thermohalophilus]
MNRTDGGYSGSMRLKRDSCLISSLLSNRLDGKEIKDVDTRAKAFTLNEKIKKVVIVMRRTPVSLFENVTTDNLIITEFKIF